VGGWRVPRGGGSDVEGYRGVQGYKGGWVAESTCTEQVEEEVHDQGGMGWGG
jgi:hypothetical protein